MLLLDYEAARPHIQTGDTVAIKGRSGLLAHFTRFFTRSDYTHTGIAFWMADGLWMFEINGGRNHIIPLSQLVEEEFDVFCRPDGLSPEAVLQAVMDNLRSRVDYGFLAIPVIGLLDFLKIKLFVHWRRILVCSGMVVKVYEDAGWPHHSRVISPRALAALLTLRLEVKAQTVEALPAGNKVASMG